MPGVETRRHALGTVLEGFANLEPAPLDIDWGAVKRWLTAPKLPMARARGSWLARVRSALTLRRILVLSAASFALCLTASL